ncbi:hypothetical protein PQR02_10970 [Paraburkholderia sediminicola]|uniref:Uncharacterized protein n=1 Tax=Paraburkholderia rhynchosiae TaxID=487049 RepID=A0ACC7NF22_9BURK
MGQIDQMRLRWFIAVCHKDILARGDVPGVRDCGLAEPLRYERGVIRVYFRREDGGDGRDRNART